MSGVKVMTIPLAAEAYHNLVITYLSPSELMGARAINTELMGRGQRMVHNAYDRGYLGYLLPAGRLS
jgi:hypothetical protein